MAKDNGDDKNESAPTYHTRAVVRACRILTTFTVDDLELSVAELHAKLGIHKSTLVRLLRCMVDEGFIEQNSANEKYRLGIKTFEIGSKYYRARLRHIEALAQPYMQQLIDGYHLSANLAVRDGSEIVYIGTMEPPGLPLRIAYSVGDRFGVHHTSLGKVLIAFEPAEQLRELVERLNLSVLTPRTISTAEGLLDELENVRRLGYSVDDEESMPGLRCVGAPIWSQDGVMAALSASGSTLVVTRERVEEIAGAVIKTANMISAQLGGAPPTT